MDKTSVLRKLLWATAVLAEIGALSAFFLGGRGTVVHEVTNGRPLIMGVELLALAGLATYAALRQTVSKGLIRLIAALNGLLAIFLVSRLTDDSLSGLSKELIAVDVLVILALTVGLTVNGRTSSQQKRAALTAGT